jgi:hypothetical protein
MKMDLMQRRRDVELKLANLQGQVQSMDTKIRAYLADRHKNPHPRHHELLEKIQQFRIDPAITNKQLEIMLDSLQWKAYYQSQAWNQLWINEEIRRRNERAAEAKKESAEHNGTGDENGRSIYSVDRLWNLQKEKLASLGKNAEPEVKEAFIGRIKKRYGQLASEKKPDEEIYMKFDAAEMRCTLEKRKREILDLPPPLEKGA